MNHNACPRPADLDQRSRPFCFDQNPPGIADGMTSLWLDGHTAAERPELSGRDTVVDVAVVGAGITGLVTAVLLARAGRRVLVIEARTPGAVTTGNTTGKASLLQGTRLSTIESRQGPESTRQYVEGNREAQAWLSHFATSTVWLFSARIVTPTPRPPRANAPPARNWKRPGGRASRWSGTRPGRPLSRPRGGAAA